LDSGETAGSGDRTPRRANAPDSARAASGDARRKSGNPMTWATGRGSIPQAVQINPAAAQKEGFKRRLSISNRFCRR
jgi:hypothetical protein